ncbi:GDSL-type esterase/lipase family protein [Acinetobacter baumannii]
MQKFNEVDGTNKDYVQIPKEVSQVLINKSPDISVPKFGSVSQPQTGNSVSLGTYILANPASQAITIKRFSVISNIASGDIELRRYTRAGDTFTMIGTGIALKINKIGVNEYNSYDFKEFVVNAGEYVAIVVKNIGAMIYNGSSASDTYYSNTSTGTSPILGNAGKLNLKAAFFDTNGVERAQAFIDYLEKVANESEINFDNILTDYAGNLGLSTIPSAKSGVNAGVGHYCAGVASVGFGKVATLEVYSAVTGSAQVGVYSKNGQVFTRKRYKDVTLNVGLNSIPIDLALSAGDYVGIRTTVAGMIEYEANTNGHDGIYVSVVGSTPDQFTASTAQPNKTYAYQVRFILALQRLSSDAGGKPWAGLKYVPFGDSITWYNGQPFSTGHIEYGQIAKGYQAYIVDALGCTLDNRGESGWKMFNIYRDRILPYNFADVHAVSIMSGYNDHKDPDEKIGTVMTIGSSFDVTTYAGALQASVEHIISSNPKTKIFLFTPIRGWYSATVAANFRDEVKNETILSIKYVNVVKQIGALYGVQVIDFYNEVGFNYLNRYTFLGDDPAQMPDYLAHPTQLGFKRMGEVALSVMKNF